MSTEKLFVFGCYRFFVTQHLLMEGDRPLRIGSRAREILAMLLERAGEIVPKEALMRRVWPSTCVEDGTLRVHMVALRSALKKDRSVLRYIETVTGIGYRFVAPLEVQWASAERGAADLDRHPLSRIVEYLEKNNVLVALDNGSRVIAPSVWAATLREMSGQN
ncbi:MAG: winged helix-turn-helix domain-containing protein [Gammaproteobacteria bacterium]